MKQCARCGHSQTKPRQNRKYCGHCEPAIRRERAERAHRQRVQKVYGLHPGDYEVMLDAQGGACAICGRAFGRSKRLAVDHDHKLGLCRAAVRGLLCGRCNEMLGHGRDDPAFFTRAIDYLMRPPAREVLT